MENNLEREYSKLEESLGFYFGRVISYPMVPPEHVYFSLTNRCNLRCKMCTIPTTPSKVEDELSVSKIKDIISQVKELGVRHLILSGGEPLLRKDLSEIVGFATSNNIEMVDIITNGVLLDDGIIQSLIKLRLNHITISLDGLQDTNDEIRGEAAFTESEKNIDKLNYYKLKYKSFFPTIGINFTIMDKNIDDILPMIEFARAKKCNIIAFQPILFNNTKMYEKKKNILWPSRVNIYRLQEIIKKVVGLKNSLNDIYIYTDKKILEVLPDYFKGKRPGNNFKCYEAIKRIVITHEGILWSCVGMYGDLKKRNLKEIWFSEEAMKARNKVNDCREHCLQDCVYFPSNILEQTKGFLEKINCVSKEGKLKIKNNLLNRIDYYRNALDTKNTNRFSKLLKFVYFSSELRNLYLIRKEIERL